MMLNCCVCLSPTCRYGFKNSPKLELVAKPKLGQREVTLSHVTHWIENKLRDLVDVSCARLMGHLLYREYGLPL